MTDSRKGLNFGIVLIIGIAAFLVLGLLAGVSDSFSLPGGGSEEEPEGNLVERKVGWMGNISTTSRNALSISSVDVDPGDANESVGSFDSTKVSNSVFWSDNSVTTKFNARKPRSLYVKFTVADADTSGRMIFNLNGNVEKRMEFQPGKTYTVKLSNVSKGQNTLLLAAESPGIMFLDTTFYDLRDIELVLNDEAFQKNIKTFRMFPYEVEGFDQGRISFSVVEDVQTPSPLRVDINGNNIMERTTVKRATPYSKKFSSVDADLRRGENTVSFYTNAGSRYSLSNVNIGVNYYATTTRKTVRETFDISSFDYGFIESEDRGMIKLDVDEIGLESPMKMSLNDRTYSFTPDTGVNKFEFKGSDLIEGENTLTLQTEGSYQISDLSVKLEE